MIVERPKIGIVMSTTREGRFADEPARRILGLASGRDDLDFELVDLRDYPLPFLGETDAAAHGDGPSSSEAPPQRWKRKMAGLDGYLFVTAEYNHSVPGVLKNALDHAHSEYNRKPAAFVGYGGVGGARAVERLRLVCVELQMAPTRTAVHISMEPYLGVTKGGKRLLDFAYLNTSAAAMLDELAWWARTLKAGRLEGTNGRRGSSEGGELPRGAVKVRDGAGG